MDVGGCVSFGPPGTPFSSYDEVETRGVSGRGWSRPGAGRNRRPTPKPSFLRHV